MKEVKHYVCDICHVEYSSKVSCEKCEKTHRKPIKIVDAKYVGFIGAVNGYPVSITVKMEDGKEVMYKR